MDLFADRISFSGLVGSALRRVWSDLVSLRSASAAADILTLCTATGIRDILPLIGKPDAIASRVLRIVVKPFMDAHCYDQHRVEQCCTKIIDENGEAVSFCEFNVLRRTPRNPSRGISLPMLIAVNMTTTTEAKL